MGLCASAALSDPGKPITLADLPQTMSVAPPVSITPSGDLGSLTEAAIRNAVEQHRGNLSAAARALGIDRSTLYRRFVWRKQSN